jgi:DNA-binding response OmpR family regulator
MSPAARILLVDDDPKVLRLLEATLRLKDYDVLKVESAGDALVWLRDHAPDLIISDIMMPDLDGYEFLRRVRDGARHPTVPFIFLSARSEPEDVVRGLQLGADEFLRKPFSIDELLVRVDRVLARGAPSAPAGERGAFEGELEHMSVPDLLRMLCVQRKSGVLDVHLREGRGEARLALRGGHVVHAVLGGMTGELVLFQLLLHDRGRFSFRPDAALDGATIAVQTLPLLMEGYRLLEMGILRRVDPNSRVAVDALGLVVAGARSASPPLPAIDDELQGVAHGQPLRMPRGRPPPGSAPADLSVDALDDDEFSETMALRPESLIADVDLPSQDELEEAPDPLESRESVVAQLGRGAAVDDDWERSGLLSYDGGIEPARSDDLDDADPLDSIQFAASFLTSEIEALEDEVAGRAARGRIMITQETATLEPEPLPTAVPEPPQSTAVALVEDTAIEVPQLAQSDAVERSEAMMDLYKHLKVETSSKLKARQTQLQTRAGQVIASDIQDPQRRTSLAGFASQAIAFASQDESTGMQFAVLDAGDLHVLVVEVDEGRLYSILFGHRPEPSAVIAALKPVLDRWRLG